MRLLLLGGLLARLVCGQAGLLDGFLPNDGQFPPAVRFIHLSRFDAYYLTRDTFVLSNQVRMQVDGIDAQAAPVGESPSPVTFNRYRGNSQAGWNTGAHLYRSVRLDNAYPGIGAAFAGLAVPGSGIGRIVFTIAPGADPARIRLRVLNTGTTPFFGPTGIWFVGGRIPGVFAVSSKATQSPAGSPVAVEGRLKIESEDTLSVEIPGRNPTLATEFEVSFPAYDLEQYVPRADGYVTMDVYYPASFGVDGSVDTSPCGGQCSNSVVARLDNQGRPLWVTLFGGTRNEASYFASAAGDGVAVSGSTTSPDFPLTASAPHRTPDSASDTFLAFFDSATGQLRNSTYAGVASNWVQDQVVEPGGDIAVAGGFNDYSNPATGYLLRWRPAGNRIVFTHPLAGRPWKLAFDSASNVYYTASITAGEESAILAGAFDAAGTALHQPVRVDVLAPWYPLNFHLHAAGGEMWFLYALARQTPDALSPIWTARVSLPQGRVLLRRQLAGMGYVTESALTPAGNLKALLRSAGPTETTTGDAPLAAACPDTSYFIILTPAGELRHATYVPTSLFDFAARNEPASPPAAAVGCYANSAGRAPLYSGAAPGQLITVTGGGFGPNDVVYTTPGADGHFPLTAAGLRVRLDGVDLPVIAAARGLVAVQVPYEVSANGQLEVVENGAALPAIPFARAGYSLDLFTTGARDSILNRPVLAALNQDGSVNSPENPAAPGSVVSLFGSGLGVLNPPPESGGFHPIPPAAPLAESPLLRTCYRCDAVLYLGSAPGLSSSVVQANLLLPSDIPGTGVRPHELGVAVATSPRNLLIFSSQGVVYVR